MTAPHSQSAREPETRRDSARGVEAYPYNPTLRLESQHGLDRLRCFSDRALAADFFAVFQAAERNSQIAQATELGRRQRDDAELQSMRLLAARAFEGKLGALPKELAAHLLLDERGTRATDERSLREFALAMRQLRRTLAVTEKQPHAKRPTI